jgi:prevent-host-death family protein
MTRLAASKAHEAFDNTLERVSEGERIVLRKGNKDVAALVPVADLKRLEEFEDRFDVEAARKAEAEATRKGEGPVPWKKARRQLGL